MADTQKNQPNVLVLRHRGSNDVGVCGMSSRYSWPSGVNLEILVPIVPEPDGSIYFEGPAFLKIADQLEEVARQIRIIQAHGSPGRRQ
jgi:hypothetical protein